MLENILQEKNDAFVFFYDETDPEAHTILDELEQIDEKLDKQDLTMVKISDEGVTASYGIEDIPALVYFENGVPELYTGDLFNDNTVMKWMKSELKQEEIKEVTVSMLEKLVEKGRTMAVVFYDDEDVENAAIMDELERIDDDCARFEISFVKVSDEEMAKQYGIDELPGLLYFENKIPSVYDRDLHDEEPLLEWLIEQKTTDTIEEVTEEILAMLIEDEEYLAVFFSGPCDEDDPCAAILNDLERIDSKMQELGIMLVTTEERELGKQYEVRYFPALGLFKNGEFVLYEGDLNEEIDILEWMTEKDTLLVADEIESMSEEMLDHFIEAETHLVAILFREGNLQDEAILDRLERIDDDLNEKEIMLVKCSDKGIEKSYGLGVVPVVVHFISGIPKVFPGDMVKENAVKNWVFENVEKTEIEEVSSSILDMLIEKHDNLAVVFLDDSDPEDGSFLQEMENMDDDLDKISIPLVKINDESKALEFGLEEMPTIVYFKRQVPGLFDGDIKDFAAILEWMTMKKKSSRIQLVSDTIMEDVIEDFEYVAVFFPGVCKEGNDECVQNLNETTESLEDISGEIVSLGIVFVMNPDRLLAYREYNVTAFPAFGLFRNGHYLAFEGDIKNSAYVLNWLSDMEALEIPGVIEKVRMEMLENIIESEDDVLVFFYDEDDKNVEDILEELETVDDNLETEAVEFVQCSDTAALHEYGLNVLPSLVYFENGVPTVYHGDLKNDDTILGWISKELEQEALTDVKSPILDSLLDRLEFVAVVYYHKNDPEDLKILRKIETIETEAKAHDIIIITVSDPRLYSKLGVEDSPTLVYYENNIPFLYKGDLEEEKKVLKWIIEQRNVASIEEINDDMLEEIIDENDFVAVLFTGLCAEDEEEEFCKKVHDNLEKIDNHLDEHGIVLVMTTEMDKAREYWISKFPAIAFFRNGDYVKFNGDPSDSRTVLKWLTNDKTINVPNKILSVNDLMLSKLLMKTEDIIVFFYEEGDIFAEKTLRELEDTEDQLADLNIDFVKISEPGIEDDYELDELPVLVHFKSGEPNVFYGDLRQEEMIADWIGSLKKSKAVPTAKKASIKKKKKKKKAA